MDTEQSGDVVGSDPTQQEVVIGKEAVLKAESPAETPAATNGDGEHVNGLSENGDSTEQAETNEDPKTEENTPADEPEVEQSSNPSAADKDEVVADEGKEEDGNQPGQAEETPGNDSIPEPAAVQEPVETQPSKEEEKLVESVANDVAAEKAEEPEKKDEGKGPEEASPAADGEGKPAEEVKEKPEGAEAEVMATTAAEETKTEPKEQEEDPTPAPGSLAFAVLEDERTKDLLSATRTLVVLRGLPGSGKSFLAQAIADVYKGHAAVVCADDHGVKPDSSDGYKAFDEAIVAKCGDGTAPVLIVVDDTNHTQDRLAHLKGVAKRHRLVAIFLEPRTAWSRDAVLLTKKNKRGLDQAKVEAMKKPHEEMSIPLYFGWFLFFTVQDKVREMSMNFLKMLTTLENFKNHLSDFSPKEGEEVDLEQYFKAKGTLHCTTKFTDYGKAEGAKEYTEEKVVQDLYGSVSELSLTALFVTPRTVGARVSLSEEQLQLWPEDAEKEADSVVPGAAALPRGSRAHVTLGCADGVPPVQTGYDLLQMLLLQKDGQQGENVEIEAGTLSYYGEGRWFLALKESIDAAACFSSSYRAKALGATKKEKKKPKCAIL